MRQEDHADGVIPGAGKADAQSFAFGAQKAVRDLQEDAGPVPGQVVGADGRPLKASLEGVGGIEGLKVILVKGVVGPRPDPNVLVINATGIFVEQ